MKKYIFILAAALTAGANLLHAQSTEHKGLLWSSLHGLDYEFKAGVNIGGTSPLPLPKEIRSLDSYSPGLAITIEGNATKWVQRGRRKSRRPLDRRCQNQSQDVVYHYSIVGKL